MKFTSFATILLILGFHGVVLGLELNGFDTTSKVLDPQVLLRVGPINHPMEALEHIKVEPIALTDWGQQDLIIGVEINGEARAYPLAIMVWHQLVNDEVGGEPILITFCRLCGTGIVYNRMVGEHTLTFGMAGLLYRSDILLYDKETHTLWSRYLDEAVTGPSQGQPMVALPFQMMSVAEWKEAYPQSAILTRDTGFDINYARTPSGDISTGDNVYAFLATRVRYHPEMPVLGIKRAGFAKAYPAGEILVAGGQVEESFQGGEVKIRFKVDEQAFTYHVSDGSEVIQSHWSEWIQREPNTDIFQAKKEIE